MPTIWSIYEFKAHAMRGAC